MTERLYYHDSYLRSFTAHIVDTAANGMVAYLDRTAFYPASGGQPFDTGFIAGVPVLEVVDEEDRIAHRLAAPLPASGVECSVDWPRRFDHMQQHTGQHLLSAVLEERFGLRTVSFHLGRDASTIDLEGGHVESRTLQEAELRANEIVSENRRVTVGFENSAGVQGLRKASEREGNLRIISIDGLDRSACGGTHVRATGEIGAILIRKPEKVRQTTRIEFLCGARAVRRARADYEALSRIGQSFSAPLDNTPDLVAAQLDSAKTADKARCKLEVDLAVYRGRELYAATAPGGDGIRRHVQQVSGGGVDALRALAQSFTSQPRAMFAAALDRPPSLLLAVSDDLGIDAGQMLKSAVAAAGGRGGGTARMAQGSVPGAHLLPELLQELIRR
ncbi:MAG TPA: DHHA1 domain-containing protein [Bryobacteraceae bacterium]|nr:DHHA1 domain-containing protein [Bryobacteraceae bacterium]